ncbi:MarR family transcriptional regulator [Corynebacterium yudongzhengii]|uniref:MarR family transcriptional regulator n=1 Tax=Corynebacterium yudongzhengii TaxID=2080740 RepID=A0A2U1T8R8_9CORY|nr:MarR family transcriptional regulator [Corynebacterium yudongzhengii]AWB81886.1 MarR family transcriptional regulator [Corynebacterium yudongzhengii]PWC02278.1 MarR family transcriptional regulator [Corynebacterium yudongzhengii]
MLAVHARYRGREVRRADIVRRSADALQTMEGVGEFTFLGVEDITARVDSPSALTDLIMALLSDGNWAIGIGIDSPVWCEEAATKAVGTRAGAVHVRADTSGTEAFDIEATFALLAHVLAKRTLEGREATSLMRRGLNQNEAAAKLGISKQAMSQRLQAAGWSAESAGWQLAVHLLALAEGNLR